MLRMNKELINHLLGYVTENRKQLFLKVIENRTRYLTVVLEDIYQSQNASAVLRTCDCFGIQDVHIIENQNNFTLNPKVVMGASKWLSLYQYNKHQNNTLMAINSLKEKGYRIIATTPHSDDTSLENFDVAGEKTALVFGTELKGISDDVIKNADGFLKIPMYGFTESFNISVSAAIILHHLTLKLNEYNVDFQLSEDEKDKLMLQWLKRSIKGAELLIDEFLKRPES